MSVRSQQLRGDHDLFWRRKISGLKRTIQSNDRHVRTRRDILRIRISVGFRKQLDDDLGNRERQSVQAWLKLSNESFSERVRAHLIYSSNHPLGRVIVRIEDHVIESKFRQLRHCTESARCKRDICDDWKRRIRFLDPLELDGSARPIRRWVNQRD